MVIACYWNSQLHLTTQWLLCSISLVISLRKKSAATKWVRWKLLDKNSTAKHNFFTCGFATIFQIISFDKHQRRWLKAYCLWHPCGYESWQGHITTNNGWYWKAHPYINFEWIPLIRYRDMTIQLVLYCYKLETTFDPLNWSINYKTLSC